MSQSPDLLEFQGLLFSDSALGLRAVSPTGPLDLTRSWSDRRG